MAVDIISLILVSFYFTLDSHDLNLTSQFLGSFLGQESLLLGMRALSLGLITITISIAVFLAENGEKFKFDRIVIIEKVIKPRSFLVWFLLLFMPLFFWNAANTSLKALLFLLYSIAVWRILALLHRSYNWVGEIKIKDKSASYRHKKRNEFLGAMKYNRENRRIWEYIWKEDLSLSEETDYLEKFIEKMNALLNQDSNYVEYYLRSFHTNLDEFTLRDLRIFENIWKASINWQRIIFERYEYSRERENRYYELKSISKKIVKESAEKGIVSGNAYVIFDVLEDLVEDKSNTKEGQKYLSEVISTVAPVIFSNADSSNARSIWSSFFPEEWKITLKRIQDGNFIVGLWLQNFLNWTKNRINKRSNMEEFDKALDKTTRELFPNADPVTLSIIISFVYMEGYRPENRMNAFVERDRVFGLMSHAHSGFVGSEENIVEGLDEKIDDETENTIKLCAHIFRNLFTEENLNDWIEDLENITLEDTSRNSYRERIIDIFEGLKKYNNEPE